VFVIRTGKDKTAKDWDNNEAIKVIIPAEEKGVIKTAHAPEPDN